MSVFIHIFDFMIFQEALDLTVSKVVGSSEHTPKTNAAIINNIAHGMSNSANERVDDVNGGMNGLKDVKVSERRSKGKMLMKGGLVRGCKAMEHVTDPRDVLDVHGVCERDLPKECVTDETEVGSTCNRKSIVGRRVLRVQKGDVSEKKRQNEVIDCDGINSTTTSETPTDELEITGEDDSVRRVMIGGRLLKVRKVGVNEQKRRICESNNKDCDGSNSDDLTLVVVNGKHENDSSDLEARAPAKPLQPTNDSDMKMFEGNIPAMTDEPDISTSYCVKTEPVSDPEDNSDCRVVINDDLPDLRDTPQIVWHLPDDDVPSNLNAWEKHYRPTAP